jgi:hypothetical protein
LLIAGAAVTTAGAVWLVTVVRRGRAWHEQDVLLRELWAAVKRIPSGYMLRDPDTGGGVVALCDLCTRLSMIECFAGQMVSASPSKAMRSRWRSGVSVAMS